jgi:hypothetical protein
MTIRHRPTEGDTKPCPRCRHLLVFSERYPVLSVGMALTRAGVDAKDRIRYERAWVCRNGGCDYRELLGDV